MELRNRQVTVTGGSGFLGKYVVRELMNAGAVVSVPRSYSFNLTNRLEVNRMYEAFEPEVVIHLAAVCGGIGANQKEPGRFLYDNLIMGAEMLDAARYFEVKKYIQVGTVCSYPKHCPVPFKEEDIWKGYPEETNAPYGIAKKTLMEMGRAYRKQYGLNAVTVIPVNLYGPGDNFDPFSSHVIPALIRKCCEAKRRRLSEVSIWGTGLASREFLYAADCAEAIVKATERYEESEPVNIGTGSEITLADLALLIKETTGYQGKLVYDPTKTDGQPRRQLDVTKAKKNFGFEAKTNLKDGLRKTVDWYESTLCD